MGLNPFSGIRRGGHDLHSEMFYDTLKLTPKNGLHEIQNRALSKEINLRYYGNGDVSKAYKNYQAM